MYVKSKHLIKLEIEQNNILKIKALFPLMRSESFARSHVFAYIIYSVIYIYLICVYQSLGHKLFYSDNKLYSTKIIKFTNEKMILIGKYCSGV